MSRFGAQNGLVWAAIASALAFLALLLGLALQLNGGVFDYPLDDVYIHLAMAEGIAAGGYGINPGEYTSAASSALYPLLLLPLAGPEFQRFLPLFWNIVGVTLSAWLWARILIAGGYGQGRLLGIGWALAIAGPVALLMSSTAFLGMEHTLHAAASLAILLGLVRHMQGQTPWALLYAGILFSPLLRYEGLALALLASGVLLLTGHRRQAVFGIVLALIPLMLFSGFLLSLGLDPLPNSVQAKQLVAVGGDLGFVQNFIWGFRVNISTGGGAILLGLVLAIWSAMALSQDIRRGPLRLLAPVLIIAAMGHLFLGQIGWMNRYEQYILVVLVAGFLVLLGALAERLAKTVIAGLAAILLAIPALWYLPGVMGVFPFGPRAISNQQGQMAVFAKQHLNAPVAVNDIGWVAWNNPNYVLDLWGLASADALRLRLGNSQAGWAGPLAAARNVPVVMIYDNWVGDAISSDWVRMGEFRLKERRGFLGGDTVTFYATAPEHVAQVRRALDTWVPELDPMTYFEFTAGSE